MRKVLYVVALIAALMIAQRARAQVLAEAPSAAMVNAAAPDSNPPRRIAGKRALPPVELEESSSRDTAARETPSRETPSRDTSSRDTSPRDTSPREITPREAGARPADPAHPLVATPLYVRPGVSSRSCANGEAPRSECSEQWRPLLRQSFQFLLIQHAGNLAMDGTMRYEISHGHWFGKWITSVANQRITRWNDGDSFLVDYIGHPMMGAVTDFLYIQNDPRGRDLTIGRNRAYWMSRVRAMAFSAVYSAQWEIGPMSEASIGNTGKDVYFSKASKTVTNGTGTVDFVMTPVAGTLWAVGEDLIDRQVIWRLEGRTNNRLALLGMSVLNPNRTVANVMRGKAPWYRDSRATRVPARMLPFQTK